MFTRYSHDELKTIVAQILQQNEELHAGAIAEQLQVTEGEVVLSLPSALVFPMTGNWAQTIVEALPSWGQVTTIVHSMGSIFEVKAPFPKGKLARGYYNLMGNDGELHGHLRLDLVEHIALVSKPFMGQESYFIGFFAAQGECVFKVYLGRDKQRNLYPKQIEKFQQLKTLAND